MNKDEVKVMRDKIIDGVNLAFERLLEEKQKDNSELVFSHKGKIVEIKAKDLIRKVTNNKG